MCIRDRLYTLMPLVLLIAIMYFLLIRPQKKREKQVNEMRSAVKVGDEVITIGGIHGTVSKLSLIHIYHLYYQGKLNSATVCTVLRRTADPMRRSLPMGIHGAGGTGPGRGQHP